VNNNLNNNNHLNDDFDIIFFLRLLWDKKKYIIFITFAASVISFFISFSLPNVYTSKSLLIPSSPEDSLSSKMGSLSTIGSFAGITMPDVPISKAQEGIERVKSYEFFLNHFLPNIKLENLVAVKKWNLNSNLIEYDPGIFDIQTERWVRDANYPKDAKPSPQEAYIIYREILSISEDNKTSFIKISLEHKSPFIAKKWLEIIIDKVNTSMRSADQDLAEKSISFLNDAYQDTNIQSIKEAISLLIEKQIQTLMLTSSNEYYVFKIIDAPIAPELKSKPNRLLIITFGTFIGFIFAVFYLIVLNFKDYVQNSN
jgi:uncharacterized protein involved in exopolysaccharide biosynthesis